MSRYLSVGLAAVVAVAFGAPAASAQGRGGGAPSGSEAVAEQPFQRLIRTQTKKRKRTILLLNADMNAC